MIQGNYKKINQILSHPQPFGFTSRLRWETRLKRWFTARPEWERIYTNQSPPGGGQLHSDCESELLDDGSYQENLWGAGFMPSTGKITYDSIINLRPRQNRSMEIMDATIREQVAEVIKQLLGDV